jgi:hypothetical protein
LVKEILNKSNIIQLKLDKDDILVLQYQNLLSEEAHKRLREFLLDKYKIKCLVLEEGMTVLGKITHENMPDDW